MGGVSAPDALAEDDLRPLRDQIREKLRSWIIDGRLEPGVPIRERDLAAQFGVSRLPVREAIRMLEGEGFVEIRARRGAVVRTLTRKDVQEVFDVREALEILEARLAALNIQDAASRRLRWLIEESQHALQAGDRDRFADINAEFHETISEASSNRTLSATLMPLAGRLQWNPAQNADSERILREHKALSDAITAHDADRAEKEARVHVRSRRQTLLDTVPE
jgi:DNA-binding GntR family transcriptional regulator